MTHKKGGRGEWFIHMLSCYDKNFDTGVQKNIFSFLSDFISPHLTSHALTLMAVTTQNNFIK